MTARYFKLGVLTLLVTGAAIAVAFVLGISFGRPRHVEYHTYFDESVQGLEIGAVVAYRGMPIGTVDAIDPAPDHFVRVALGVDRDKIPSTHLANVPPDLRAELSMQGITGVKLVDLDFVDPAAHPPPKVGFEPGPRYIPSSPSMLENLSNDLAGILERLAPLIEATTSAIHRVDDMLASFDRENVPQQVGDVLRTAQGAATDLRRLLGSVDRAKLPDKAAVALDRLDSATASMDDVLERVGGQEGLVANANRVVRGFGGARTGDEFARTLRNLDAAARAVRDLAHTIDRQPDVLLKGRSKGQR